MTNSELIHRPETQVLRLTNMRWHLRSFAHWITELAKLPRPSGMVEGLWEYPLTKPHPPEWRRTEYITQPELQKMGGPTAMMGGNGALVGPWQDVAVDFSLQGIPLTRLRLLALAPQTVQHTHKDIESPEPVWRFHLPLLTHPRARLDYFSPTPATYHLPADGHGYLINVAHTHRVVNEDTRRWRLHLVGDPLRLTNQLKLAILDSRIKK